jgi:hypothetical protein
MVMRFFPKFSMAGLVARLLIAANVNVSAVVRKPIRNSAIDRAADVPDRSGNGRDPSSRRTPARGQGL